MGGAILRWNDLSKGLLECLFALITLKLPCGLEPEHKMWRLGNEPDNALDSRRFRTLIENQRPG